MKVEIDFDELCKLKIAAKYNGIYAEDGPSTATICKLRDERHYQNLKSKLDRFREERDWWRCQAKDLAYSEFDRNLLKVRCEAKGYGGSE